MGCWFRRGFGAGRGCGRQGVCGAFIETECRVYYRRRPERFAVATEWTNLASNPEYEAVKAKLKKQLLKLKDGQAHE